MILVDNFKIILMVGLIYAVGLHQTDALMCKTADPAEPEACTEFEETKCKVDDNGPAGCAKPADCEADKKIYCCGEDDCNDLEDETRNGEICKAKPDLKECDKTTGTGGAPRGGDTSNEKTGMSTTAKSTASGMFDTYYGGIPLVTLVSASIYYLPLKWFL